MTENAPSAPEQKADGNTKRRLGNEAKHWIFTWNSYPANAQEMLQKLLDGRAKVLCYSSEIGESGNKHLQGYIELQTKSRWSRFGLPDGIHWEIARDPKRARDYAIKRDKTYDNEANIYFTYGYYPIAEQDLQLITYEQMYPWQKDVVTLLSMPLEKRRIHWYYDEIGNVGKTSLVRYMGFHFSGQVVWTSSTNGQNIMTIAHAGCRMYLFDFSRSSRQNVPYETLEELKNGMITCGKLLKTMRQEIVPPAHIVVFANWEPDYNALSADRWVVRDITRHDSSIPPCGGPQTPDIPCPLVSDAATFDDDL